MSNFGMRFRGINLEKWTHANLKTFPKNFELKFYSKSNHIEDEKIELNLTDNENEIKKIIFNKIIQNNNLENYIQTGIRYFDTTKEEITIENFKKQFSVNNIELYYKRSIEPKSINKFFRITNFLDENNSIVFKVKFFPNQKRLYKKKTFSLFDINNNFITKISVPLSTNLKKCHEIVYFLFSILNKFYPNIPKEDFFFLLQNSNKIMILDIFI